MSLDDETPTQYFGPGAQVWKSKDGRALQLSPAEAAKFGPGLSEIGWIHSGQEPLTIGPELANPEITEPIHHRSGCPVKRTGKCLCTYLAQWDRDLVSNGMPPVALEASKERQIAEANFEQLLNEEMAKPLTAFTAQEEAAGRVITIDTLNGRTSEWDGVFKDPEPQLQLPVVIVTGQADAAEIAEKIVKDNPRWFGELPAGTYQKQEPAAEQLRLNTELSLTFWKGQAKHWQKGYWIMAGSAVVGWGLAVARGVWGF